MDITFNFIGMCVADWQRAHSFFTETMKLEAELNPVHGDWANLSAAWDGYYSGAYSMVCELFDQGKTVSERWWGRNQNIRPAIHVRDLDAAIEHWQKLGVPFTGVGEDKPWGREIEFETVEGIRWSVLEVKNRPISTDLSRPHFGHINVKVADFEGQLSFYQDKMGFVHDASGDDYAVLKQHKPDHPFIILHTGGEVVKTEVEGVAFRERSHPFFLSFMTPDIQAVGERCDAFNVPTLSPITHHDDWGGTDMMMSDADGNIIQVVQYG